MGEYEDWLAGLSVGDKVAVTKHMGDGYSIGTITKITPSRHIQLNGYEPKYKNGMIRYDSYSTSRIYPLTDKIKESVYRKVTINHIKTMNLDELSTDKLREIRKIIDGKA